MAIAVLSEVRGFGPGGAADGRVVSFHYEDADACKQLTEIRSNGASWTYHYSPLAERGDCKVHLDEVVLPTGERWRYAYYPDGGTSEPGRNALAKVTYPYGGEVSFTYQEVYFNPYAARPTVSIATRSTSGPDVTAGTWEYIFYPGALLIDC